MTSLPTPNPRIQTSFVVGCDGTTYINIQGQKERTLAGRRMFVGSALTRREVAKLGPVRLRPSPAYGGSA